nr:cycloartenol synthase 2-like isoform X2 [Ipomoea batatas]
MWKLKLSDGKDDPLLRSVNNYIGRQYWEYDPNLGTQEEREQVEKLRAKFHKNRFEIKHSSDLLMRMQFEKEKAQEMGLQQVKVGSVEEISEEAVVRTLRRGLRFYSTIQADDGHWPGDYGGPLFLLPCLVIGLSVIGELNAILQEEHQKEILRYIYNHQNVDGGWGLHIEGHSTMFGTALNYVTLRILGEESDGGNGAMKEARKWILDHGGATFIPSWGKLWLSEDLYYPHPAIQDIVWYCLHNIIEPLLNKWPFNKLRKKALTLAMDHIQHEDETTNYVCIGPVNKVLNMICRWIEDPNSFAVKLHLSRIKDYLWLAEDGMKMKGYNGSQLWDVDLAVQAILATNLSDEYDSMLKKAHFFINVSQAALMLSRMPDDVVGEAIEPSRLYDAVDLILSLQMLNPSESLGKVILDYPCVECTTSAIIGLKYFRKLHPGYRRKEIEACINKALTFLLTIQLPDGSWYGTWGVCYTYGTWFGIRGLVAGGNTYETCHGIRKACDFLLSKQLPSGGWGESYLSCQDKVYTNIEGNKWHIVNTAWVLMALIHAGQVECPLNAPCQALVEAPLPRPYSGGTSLHGPKPEAWALLGGQDGPRIDLRVWLERLGGTLQGVPSHLSL